MLMQIKTKGDFILAVSHGFLPPPFVWWFGVARSSQIMRLSLPNAQLPASDQVQHDGGSTHQKAPNGRIR
jgi:hypothetical protein